GVAYFGSKTTAIPGRVAKVALGAGNNPPARVDGIVLNNGENEIAVAVIDPCAGYAYFGRDISPAGKVIKIALGSSGNTFSRVASTTLDISEEKLVSAVIDSAAGYAYFGTYTTPGKVIKVALGGGNTTPTRVGAVTLNAGEDSLWSAVIDANAGYAWFGTYTTPGRVIKVALGAGSNPPTRVGAVTLDPGEDYLACAAIDSGAGYAYFGTLTIPGKVVKVALGSGSNPPTRVGAVTLLSGEELVSSAVIDPEAGYAYFGTATLTNNPGRVVKVELGTGNNPPTRVGAVTLNSGEQSLVSALIDPAAGYAYFGTWTNPGFVVKVALGAGSDPPTRVGAVTLGPGEYNLKAAGIDTRAGFAYFGSYTVAIPGRVAKVALGAGNNPPTRVGGIVLNNDENKIAAAVIDPCAGYAYFGRDISPKEKLSRLLSAVTKHPLSVSEQ
ncbi:MAG: hypothetical protein IPI28_15285, partial [Candidatus Omnitrophica bacterium]|nr:hypothetical protein [Candidatus Omnitrophota bacterium]